MKVTALLILFIVIVSLISCNTEKVKPEVNNELLGENLPDQESWNSTVFFTDSGKTRAVLYAGHLRTFDKTHETLLDSNIKVDFYNMNEIKTTTLTAKRGRVDEKTNNLYAMDSVVTVNDSGVVIRTDKMMWNNKQKKILSEDFVTIVTPQERIEGYGFESDQNLRNYVIYNITYITNSDSLKQ